MRDEQTYRPSRRAVLRLGAAGLAAGVGYSTSAAAAPSNVIAISGRESDEKVTYEFTVSGALEKSTANGGTINGGDRINGRTATGVVGTGVDSYAFSGEVTDFSYDGSPRVYVNGDEVNPDGFGALSNTFRVKAASDERATYEVTVSGEIRAGPAFDDDGTDAIDGSSATGRVAGGGDDDYTFSGDVTGFSYDGPLRTFVNGTEVNPDSLGGSGGSGGSGGGSGGERSLVVQGSGDPATYEIRVSRSLSEGSGPGSLNGGDSISADGTSATGSVGGGADPYAFSGEVVSVTVDGPATVLVDGEVYEPDSGGGGNGGGGTRTLTFEGTGSVAQYTFTVSGSLAEADGPGSLSGPDRIEGTSASGAVGGGADSYLFGGEITALSVDGNARVLVDGEEVDPDSFGDDGGSSGNSWTEKARLPRAQTAAGSGVIDGQLYYFGGFTSGRRLAATSRGFVYDPSAGSDGRWDRIPDLPAKLWAPCGVSTGSRIFSFGGAPPNDPYSGDPPTDSIYAYTPGSGWKDLTAESGVRCPYPNWAMSGVYDPDRDLIYCVGGGTNVTDRESATDHGARGNSLGRVDESRIWVFDPGSERVVDPDFARLPEAKRWSTVGLVDVGGTTYLHSICGGLGVVGDTDSNFRIDLDSGRIRRTRSAPRAGMFATTANPVLENEIYLVDGRFDRDYTTRSFRYDPDADRFSSDVARPDHPRNRAADAVIDGTLYVVGGHVKNYSTGGHDATTYNEAYTPPSG